MALVPASSHGGSPAGLSNGIVYQTGSGDPVDNALTPAQTGAVYQDLTNGGLYIAIGATSASWIAVGGNTNPGAAQPNGVMANTDFVALICPTATPTNGVTLADSVSWTTGTGNGLKWNPHGADGSQTLTAKLGSTGQYVHLWAADGSYTAPSVATAAAAAAATNLPRLSQLSPKFTITSGALPTQALASGTGAQVSTTRDVETVTPFSGDGTNNAATCAIALSPDNTTYSTLATISIAAALNLTGVLTDNVNLRVPAGWYIKLTAVHGTLGTTTYY